MNITGRVKNFFTKASQTTSTIVQMFGAGDPVWTKKDYEKMAKAAYKNNGWVYACIDSIAKAAKDIPLHLEEVDSEGETREVDSHDALDLIDHPNKEQGKGEFIEAVFSYWMISGNSYIEKVPTSGRPNELHTLRPDRMTVEKDKKQRIGGYEYRAGGGKTNFDPETILHLRLFDPVDDWYGMSPLEAVAKTVDQHNAATEWNTALMQNYGKVSGFFIAEGRLDDDQFERMKKEVRDEYAGVEDAGSLGLLEGGVDFKKVQTDPTDLDWLEGMENSGKIIHGAFGVPTDLTSLGSKSKYENRKEARKALYSETVLPLYNQFLDDFNYWLFQSYDRNLQLTFDKNEIPAMSEDEQKLWERIREADHLTINEKRKATGYEPIPGGDVILRPQSDRAMITAEESTEGGENE